MKAVEINKQEWATTLYALAVRNRLLRGSSRSASSSLSSKRLALFACVLITGLGQPFFALLGLTLMTSGFLTAWGTQSCCVHTPQGQGMY